ncbi:MAG: TonB-dependent receptor [Alcanivorax sp.]|nr:TonB-dependent receptor [Alcanivorax sp. ZXX171]MBU60569.1 TonB-dependent receptor [Alcanivorax sp.]UWN50554.1 Ferripyoverdine receptor [Alcanivorax sp. ALC70]HCE40682.1 TonB-dependent receptor [Alcanivorax sp.]|tara:strand:- start:68810 stop:71185 length:2376 start_codon:yes stop_codon:yes gene_type:complete
MPIFIDAGWRAACRRLLLPVCLAAPLALPVPVAAQTAVDGQHATHEFAIPAGPLDDALASLARQAGLTVSAAPELLAGRRAAAVQGRYGVQDALDRMLAGTGLRYRFTGDNSFVLEPAPTPRAAVLGPVKVYGAKTTTQLEDTTASVGVVTSEQIERAEIGSFRDAFRTLGNVMDGDWPDAGFVIRGINSEGLTPGGDPLASLYVDGARQTVNGARRGARGLWDVEQVEVYRGPQSTLTGRAALAGAVYVKTKDPTFEPESRARLAGGSMKTREAAVMTSGPLIDDELAYRFAAEYHTSENDIDYPTYEGFDRYDDFVEDEYYQLRGKLLWLPEALPDTNALLSYSFSHDSPYIDDVGGPELGFDYDEERGDFNTPVFVESRVAETQNLSLEITHALGADLTLTSLTAWSDTDMDRPSVNEGTAGETNVMRGDTQQSIVSQELRANYDRDRWRWVSGLYAAREEERGQYTRPDYFGNADRSRTGRDLDNYALFGEAGYRFKPGWEAVLGGRVDYTSVDETAFFARNGGVVTDDRTSHSNTVFLPKLALIRTLAPMHTLGFTVQKGYRTGGAGIQRSSNTEYRYDDEQTWTYELSYKGVALDRRLQLSANLFYTDWSDQQVGVLGTPGDSTSRRVTNAGESTLQGFELEGRYRFNPRWSGFASIGYVDTEFDEFVDNSLGDLSGLPFPEAPEWNAALGAFYQHPGGFFAGADAKYVSRYLARFGADPQEYVDGYTVANARVGLRADDWTVTLYSENVFDRDYYVYNDRNTSGDVAATLGPRRVTALSVEMSF